MRDTSKRDEKSLRADMGKRVTKSGKAKNRKRISSFRISNLVYSLPSYPVIPELRNEISGISCHVLLVIFGVQHKERFPIMLVPRCRE